MVGRRGVYDICEARGVRPVGWGERRHEALTEDMGAMMEDGEIGGGRCSRTQGAQYQYYIRFLVEGR